MTTVGILGGSFNPVHYGHIALARNIVDSGSVDEVWLSLSPRNPFKEQKDLMPDNKRLRLLRDAVKNQPGLKAQDLEFSLPKPSYTVDALREYSKRYPEYAFRWIIGSDNLTRFTSWKEWQTILKSYGVIVYPRGTTAIVLPEALKPYAHFFTLLPEMPLYNISSTQLRARHPLH